MRHYCMDETERKLLIEFHEKELRLLAGDPFGWMYHTERLKYLKGDPHA